MPKPIIGVRQNVALHQNSLNLDPIAQFAHRHLSSVRIFSDPMVLISYADRDHKLAHGASHRERRKSLGAAIHGYNEYFQNLICFHSNLINDERNIFLMPTPEHARILIEKVLWKTYAGKTPPLILYTPDGSLRLEAEYDAASRTYSLINGKGSSHSRSKLLALGKLLQENREFIFVGEETASQNALGSIWNLLESGFGFTVSNCTDQGSGAQRVLYAIDELLYSRPSRNKDNN